MNLVPRDGNGRGLRLDLRPPLPWVDHHYVSVLSWILEEYEHIGRGSALDNSTRFLADLRRIPDVVQFRRLDCTAAKFKSRKRNTDTREGGLTEVKTFLLRQLSDVGILNLSFARILNQFVEFVLLQIYVLGVVCQLYSVTRARNSMGSRFLPYY